MELDAKRAAVLDAVLGHLLARGLDDAGVRALAAAAGVSDRMLIYYFGDKDTLIRAALDRLTDRLSEGLEAIVGAEPADAETLIAQIDAAAAIPEFDQATRLVVEVAARAGRGIEPYRTAAKEIVARWEAWLDAHLAKTEGGPTTREVLVMIEGRLFLRVIEA